jgi:hypothetical protein
MTQLERDKKIEALMSLKPNTKWTWGGDDLAYADLDWRDSSAKPTEAEINAEVTRLETVFSNNSYQRKRKSEYPDYGEQLDMQYWDQVNGTTKWKEAIAKVKSDNPKP